MAKCKILSYNIKSLNTPEKRTMMEKELWRLGGDVVLLQETHFRTGKFPKMNTHRYPIVYNAGSETSRSKGVSILISRRMAFSEKVVEIDEEGRWIFLKGHCLGHLFTFLAVYAPNTAQIGFMKSLLESLMDKVEGTLVIGGDFNCPLRPELDTSKGSTTISKRSLKSFAKTLTEYQLVDPWRLINPNEKDFTFYSAPHDILLIPHVDFHLVQSTEIGNITISDHAPISLNLRWGENMPRQSTWRLNESMLQDQVIVTKVREEMRQYFGLKRSLK